MDSEQPTPNPEAPEGGTPAAASAPPRRAPRDAQGMNRPEFLLDFPEDPELDALISAFEAGNYAHIRREAEKLAGKTSDPRVRDAALELRRRIDPDPLARYLLAIAFLLLVFLTVWAYHSGAH